MGMAPLSTLRVGWPFLRLGFVEDDLLCLILLSGQLKQLLEPLKKLLSGEKQPADNNLLLFVCLIFEYTFLFHCFMQSLRFCSPKSFALHPNESSSAPAASVCSCSFSKLQCYLRFS